MILNHLITNKLLSKIMMLHRKIFVITLLLFLGGGLFVQAQTRVSGQVIDEQGEPIPFANVIFKNTHIGTACDENGKFSLFSQKNYTTIEVSSVGFTTKEVKLKGHDTEKLKIVLAIEELEALWKNLRRIFRKRRIQPILFYKKYGLISIKIYLPKPRLISTNAMRRWSWD